MKKQNPKNQLPPQSKDETGNSYHKATVTAYVGKSGTHSRWACVCDCGNEFEARGDHLRNGNIKSCGCNRKGNKGGGGKGGKGRYSGWVIHGHRAGGTKSREYNSWEAMRRRCTDTNHKGFNRYGGRGISVCQRWADSFQNFLSDLGTRPDGRSLDRIDNSGNYTPSNCRWATPITQANNKD